MNFFIAGLPRSRTAWLANLLTTGSSLCWHDAFAECRTVAGLASKLAKAQLSASSKIPYFGNSDSVQARFAPELVKEWPNAKWVFVGRGFEESYVSFINAAPAGIDSGVARENFEVARDAIFVARDFVRPKNQMNVGFAYLGLESIVREVWEFCLPGVPWNAERWALLDKFRVTVIPEKAYNL